MPRARIPIVAPDEETGELYSLSLGSPAQCGTTITTHEHNGHHGVENDGFTGAFFFRTSSTTITGRLSSPDISP
jgi:hypothetical protein